ncbi:extracellular solute-binding protein [Defluviitalea raffinosedens]|uniref:Extracellular solute-binding protein n=1 Tax=Defluviitalea raffinosedens TaxID=1450156 RepID=A0A7C8HGW1_9FIRM|nr:extracellular solute-binding protein [Defluviitalea raffinosedens]KAE9634890.1 extracellular solute-binding protein [Defluviitalea raffinosedens]MBM7685679.1 arabinogalactan oligomer/maltooligosaccharide transport system substrate-binding protein [Defluviitalea raffinosedens]
MSKKLKKVMALVLAAVMSTALFAGCGNKGASTSTGNSSTTTSSNTQDTGSKEKVTLKVWGAQEEQPLLKEMVESFKAAHPEKEYDITLAVVSESDLKGKYLDDPAAAADVFAFANDQIWDLYNAGALYEVTRNKDAIISANIEGAVDAATIDGKLYAYPMTADNGYFLYYDKSVISDEEAKTLDGILAAADKAGKKVVMDISNGYYIASFFFGAGCTLKIENGKQVCDFNNANGLKAAEAIKAFTAHNAFMTGDDPVITAQIGDTVAAAVTGTWNAEVIKSKLGDNFGVAKLPTYTSGSEQIQMGSFMGYKLVGVNSQTKFPVDAMDFAEWITNEENQKLRYEKRGLGPSNKNVAESEAVKSNPVLGALAEQSKYAVSQKDVLGSYWTPAEAFGAALEAKDYSKSLQELLDEMVAQIQQ